MSKYFVVKDSVTNTVSVFGGKAINDENLGWVIKAHSTFSCGSDSTVAFKRAQRLANTLNNQKIDQAKLQLTIIGAIIIGLMGVVFLPQTIPNFIFLIIVVFLFVAWGVGNSREPDND